MESKELRVQIPKELHTKFKILCIEMDLSMPKQTAQLIENFVTIQEDNLKKMKNAKKGR
jgi:predicted transcriptional regulator YheO